MKFTVAFWTVRSVIKGHFKELREYYAVYNDLLMLLGKSLLDEKVVVMDLQANDVQLTCDKDSLDNSVLEWRVTWVLSVSDTWVDGLCQITSEAYLVNLLKCIESWLIVDFGKLTDFLH